MRLFKALASTGFIAGVIAFAAAMVLLVYRVESSNESTRPEYSYSVIVDDSSKVPQAITNAINAVTSKGFVLTQLSITKAIIGGNYITVHAGGKDFAKILEM